MDPPLPSPRGPSRFREPEALPTPSSWARVPRGQVAVGASVHQEGLGFALSLRSSQPQSVALHVVLKNPSARPHPGPGRQNLWGLGPGIQFSEE